MPESTGSDLRKQETKKPRNQEIKDPPLTSNKGLLIYLILHPVLKVQNAWLIYRQYCSEQSPDTAVSDM